jgi:hypothetical protein
VNNLSDEQVRHSPSYGSTRAIVMALTLLVLAASVAIYVRIGWWRMESACSLDDARGPVAKSVSYGWSWQPLGFRCTYDNGTADTSLWF